MNWINRLERKYGRFAVPNLTAIIIGLYAAGYLLSVMAPNILGYLTLEPYYIFKGQIWRLVTWLIVPPSSLNIFTIIMLFFYFSIGRILERTWGDFRYNLYIFTGLIFTVLGALILFGLQMAGALPLGAIGYAFSTYYINMSIFLAFALSYPDMQVLLYFIIPVKMKWMGLIYGVLIIYDLIRGTWPMRVAIIASLLNFVVYYLMIRKSQGSTQRQSVYRQAFENAMRQRGAGGPGARAGGNQGRAGGPGAGNGTAGAGMGTRGGASGRPAAKVGPMHRCAICGRTELDDDQLIFRYCSKCEGAYEYCQDHLFNHEHKTL